MSQLAPLHAYDEVVSFFAGAPDREAIANFRLSPAAVERVRSLLLKKSAGTLTPAEEEELDQCVQIDRLMMLIRSRARQQLQDSRGA